MAVIELGNCCLDCFDGINGGEVKPVIHNDIANIKTAENLTSIHTGESQGFSWSPCAICKSILGGERFEVFGIIK